MTHTEVVTLILVELQKRNPNQSRLDELYRLECELRSRP